MGSSQRSAAAFIEDPFSSPTSALGKSSASTVPSSAAAGIFARQEDSPLILRHVDADDGVPQPYLELPPAYTQRSFSAGAPLVWSRRL